MRRPLALVAATTLAATAAATAAVLAPAQAITDGVDDNGGHPMVGLVAFHDGQGNPLWSCSGVMIGPTAFLTAGHCTSDERGDDVARAELFFGDSHFADVEFLADVGDGDDPGCLHDTTGETHGGYPCSGDHSGTPRTVPGHDPAQAYRRDVGVVVLDEPYRPDGGFGLLPEVGAYDPWDSRRDQRFRVVGYGDQRRDDEGNHRRVARPELVGINTKSLGDVNIMLSNHRTKGGGTCAGDSGGPAFVEGTMEIAGVVSWNRTDKCGSRGAIYRLDREVDRAWLAGFLP